MGLLASVTQEQAVSGSLSCDGVDGFIIKGGMDEGPVEQLRVSSGRPALGHGSGGVG